MRAALRKMRASVLPKKRRDFRPRGLRHADVDSRFSPAPRRRPRHDYQRHTGDSDTLSIQAADAMPAVDARSRTCYDIRMRHATHAPRYAKSNDITRRVRAMHRYGVAPARAPPRYMPISPSSFDAYHASSSLRAILRYTADIISSSPRRPI